jgi:hypothetical protein
MTWTQLGKMLLLGGPSYHIWREAPWQSFAISDTADSPRVRAYQLVESPYAKLLKTPIEQWLKRQPLLELDKTATFLLGLRFQVVGNLFLSLDCIGSLMPPPPADEIGMSRQFLINWWRDNGAFYAVGSECATLNGIP